MALKLKRVEFDGCDGIIKKGAKGSSIIYDPYVDKFFEGNADKVKIAFYRLKEQRDFVNYGDLYDEIHVPLYGYLRNSIIYDGYSGDQKRLAFHTADVCEIKRIFRKNKRMSFLVLEWEKDAVC